MVLYGGCKMDFKTEIDIYEAGNDVFLILTGLGGSTKGYQNKYVIMANNIKNKFDKTVFVASLPSDVWNMPKELLDYVLDHIHNERLQNGINDYKIYAFGHSAGGTLLLHYANFYKEIKRVLASNPVLGWNLHKLKDSIKNFSGDFIKIVVGDKDQSSSYSEFVNEFIDTKVLKDTDHDFRDKLDEFVKLPEIFLF